MSEQPLSFRFYLNSMWFIVALLFASLVVLVVEQRNYESAFAKREKSVKLAEELRQSSNDLTKLARNYITTLDPVYKEMFNEVVSIRNGDLPRPKNYTLAYWDLKIRQSFADEEFDNPTPLLELMRLSGLTESEWIKASTAKQQSDLLVEIEKRAMALVEEDTPVDLNKRNLALAMLADNYFINTKADIMQPIIEAEQMIFARTQLDVDRAKTNLHWATSLVLILCLVLAALIFKLSRQQRRIIGCSIPALQAIIAQLGQGDFYTNIPITEHNKNSVLGWIAKTQKRLAELNLGHFRAIVDSSDDAIISKNLSGEIASWNSGAERVFGYSSDQMIGQPMMKLIPTNRQHEEPDILERIARGEKVDHFETQRLHKNGHLIDVSVTISPIYGQNGKVIGASKIARDITKAKAAEAEIHRLAYYDALTGLANRRYLYSALKDALHSLMYTQSAFAIYFLDLDNFKPINDTLGHETGDLLLKAVALRFSELLQTPDFASRFGGDEFIIVKHSPKHEGTDHHVWVADFAQTLQKAMAEPYFIGSSVHHCSVSIGVCLAQQNSVLSVDDMIQRADQAMYQAKLNGKNQYAIFESDKL